MKTIVLYTYNFASVSQRSKSSFNAIIFEPPELDYVISKIKYFALVPSAFFSLKSTIGRLIPVISPVETYFCKKVTYFT